MARRPFVEFPSWRYGPGGQSAIFQRPGDIPPGWVDHPSKVQEADPLKDADTNQDEVTSIPEIRAALESGKLTTEQVRAAEAKRQRPRSGVAKLLAEFESTQATEVSREQALRELREKGVEIADDATDEEIEAALNSV